ncbi:hypothetical protein KM043_017992 [Ampulex compressa]|nr:hypothetical protein KM043_017992 [Ampulex compressa]
MSDGAPTTEHSWGFPNERSSIRYDQFGAQCWTIGIEERNYFVAAKDQSRRREMVERSDQAPIDAHVK